MRIKALCEPLGSKSVPDCSHSQGKNEIAKQNANNIKKEVNLYLQAEALLSNQVVLLTKRKKKQQPTQLNRFPTSTKDTGPTSSASSSMVRNTSVIARRLVDIPKTPYSSEMGRSAAAAEHILLNSSKPISNAASQTKISFTAEDEAFFCSDIPPIDECEEPFETVFSRVSRFFDRIFRRCK